MNMKLEKGLIISVAVGFLVVLLGWSWNFRSAAISGNPSDWGAFGDYLGGVLSPILAFVSFMGLLLTIREQRAGTDVTRVVNDDRQYFEHAVSSLQRAYEVITNDGQQAVPAKDRLKWLTCARLLLAAKKVSKRISIHSEGLKDVYRGEEEHWRRKFYDLLKPISTKGVGATASYFKQDDSEHAIQIEERSIKVIFDFAEWPDGMHDPIDDVPLFSEEEIERMTVGKSGVRSYVLSLPRFANRK